MLALDGTVGCIEASESEVLDLYRSAALAAAAPASQRLEAYVCAIKKKIQVRVYLALVADDRKIYVYTKPGKPDNESGYHETVREALGYAKAMGFEPEKVDLSYSPAMREVVVRNTKILRPPGSKAGGFLKHGLSGAPILPLAPDTGTPAPGTQQVQVLQQGVDAHEMEQTILSLREELASLAAERDAHLQRLQEANEQQRALAGQLAAAAAKGAGSATENEGAHLYKEQIDALLPQMEQAERRVRELEEQNGVLRAELAEARDEAARLEADMKPLLDAASRADSVAAKLEALHEDNTGLAARLERVSRQHLETEGGRKALAEALSLARSEVDSVTAQRDKALESLEKLRGELSEAGAKADALSRELEAATEKRQADLQRIESLEREQRQAEAKAASLADEVSDLGSAKEAVSLQFEEMLQRNRKAEEELLRLRRESSTLESERQELLGKLAAAGQLKGQLERETPAAAALPETAAPPAPAEMFDPDEMGINPAPLVPEMSEREREFAVFSALSEEAACPATLPEIPPFLDMPAEAPANWSEATTPPPAGGWQGDFFSAADDGLQPVRFLLQPGLASIDYAGPEEVVEMYQSINNANLAPEGKGQENCRGYICSLKRGERLTVFAAVHGTSSGRTWVYLPENQPEDESGYLNTLRGAMAFAEEVGLMMEPVSLDCAALRQGSLHDCPALRKAA